VKWDFTSFPEIEEKVVWPGFRLSLVHNATKNLTNDLSDAGAPKVFSQIKIASNRDENGEYQKFRIDNCAPDDPVCMNEPVRGNWNLLEWWEKTECKIAWEPWSVLGLSASGDTAASWEWGRRPEIPFEPIQQIEWHVDRKTVVIADPAPGDPDPGKRVVFFDPATGEVEREFSSSVNSGSQYPPAGLSDFSMVLGSSSLTTLGLAGAGEEEFRMLIFIYGGKKRLGCSPEISTSVTKRLDVVDERILYPDMLFFDAHIFGKTVINNGGTESSTFDIDTLEVRWHPHNTGSRDLVGSYYQTKIAYQSWVDSAKYGHPSTDVFVFDVSDDSLVRLTEDERSQWIPKIYGNLVLWQELINEKAEEGYGYYVIYDLDTGVRRRIPGIENDGWVWGVTKTHAAIRGGASSVSAPLYLVDLEKADVVKDGHVVPEVKDGGTSGQ
jgi:hypothetical protein